MNFYVIFRNAESQIRLQFAFREKYNKLNL